MLRDTEMTYIQNQKEIFCSNLVEIACCDQFSTLSILKTLTCFQTSSRRPQNCQGLEDISDEKQLTELGLFSFKRVRLQGNLISVHHYQWEGIEKMEPPWKSSDHTRQTHSLQNKKFRVY